MKDINNSTDAVSQEGKTALAKMMLLGALLEAAKNRAPFDMQGGDPMALPDSNFESMIQEQAEARARASGEKINTNERGEMVDPDGFTFAEFMANLRNQNNSEQVVAQATDQEGDSLLELVDHPEGESEDGDLIVMIDSSASAEHYLPDDALDAIPSNILEALDANEGVRIKMILKNPDSVRETIEDLEDDLEDLTGELAENTSDRVRLVNAYDETEAKLVSGRKSLAAAELILEERDKSEATHSATLENIERLRQHRAAAYEHSKIADEIEAVMKNT